MAGCTNISRDTFQNTVWFRAWKNSSLELLGVLLTQQYCVSSPYAARQEFARKMSYIIILILQTLWSGLSFFGKELFCGESNVNSKGFCRLSPLYGKTSIWLFWDPSSCLTECSSAKNQNQNQRIIFIDLEISSPNTLLRAGSSLWWVAWGCIHNFSLQLAQIFDSPDPENVSFYLLGNNPLLRLASLASCPFILRFVKVSGKRLLLPSPWPSAGQQLDPTTDCSSPSWTSPAPPASCLKACAPVPDHLDNPLLIPCSCYLVHKFCKFFFTLLTYFWALASHLSFLLLSF